jgi:cysteine desulfurase / selenocysteine lyase
VEVTMVRGDAQGVVDPAAIGEAITPRTRLVVANHASNVCGSLLDAAAVGEVCRGRGVAYLLDASQTLGAVPVDVEALGVSMLAAPGHKSLLGPQGTGILYVHPSIDLAPFVYGGTGSLSESPEMPEEMPERLEGGTLNTPGIAGLAAGIEYIRERGVENIRKAEEAAVARLLELLAGKPQILVYGPKDPKKMVSVVSFNLVGRDGAHVGYVLDELFSIAVRVGLHCAPEAHKTIGTFPVGTVRASFGPFNTPADAERLAKALDTILSI